VTDFQPTFPAEVPFTDAELAFLDESPPGLFPENQNSNFGFIIRKIFSDRIQDLINQLNVIYSEKFVLTATQYLDEWEETVGLPVNTGLYSTAQRRNLILNRLRKGAFTRAMRRAIVESFIIATFGDAPGFDPTGIPFDSSGIPLYSGISSLAGTYVIREPHPWRNLIDNPSYEVDVVGATAGTGGTLARSTTQAKYGVGSALLTLTGTAGSLINQVLRSGSRIPVTAGTTYTLSAFHRQSVGTRQTGIGIDWYNGSGTIISSPRLANSALAAGSWLQKSLTAVAPAGAVTAWAFPIITGTGTASDAIYTDGVQFEEGTTPTDFSDPAETPFAYEVRILSTLGVDVIGLARELTRVTPAGISFTITQTPSP
jgi:hypothetical protein